MPTALGKKYLTCQNPQCLKTSDTEKQMSTCGGCRMVHYCSRDCQTAHWKVHKPRCKESAAIQEKMKSASAEQKQALESGITNSKLFEDLRKWSQRHRSWQMGILVQVLRLRSRPDKWRTHGVFVELEAHNTTPTSNSKPYLFTMVDAFEVTHDEIFSSLKDIDQEHQALALKKQMADTLKEEKNDAKVAGLVLIKCPPAVFVVPMFAERDAWNAMSEYDDWKERTSLILRVPDDPDYPKIVKQLEQWANKHRSLLAFVIINCLDLKKNRNKTTTHLAEMPMFVSSSGSGSYHFAPLTCTPITFDLHAQRSLERGGVAGRDQVLQLQELCKTTRENAGGVQGIAGIVLMMCGTVPICYPLFMSAEEIETTENRADWQSYKHTFSDK